MGTDLVLTNAGAQWRAKAFDCVIRRFEEEGRLVVCLKQQEHLPKNKG